MRKRGSTPTRTSTSGQPRRSRLASAATMLPLALGLAANMSGPQAGQKRASGTGPFAPVCSMPFQAIEQHHPSDDSCGLSGGERDDTTARALQNAAKNNFCASGKPVSITFDVLHQLQQDAASAGISFGSDSQIPPDRKVLKNLATKVGNIGEGTVARLSAFVIAAHYSNVGKGESVNCNQPDAASNDIHIVLGEKSNKDDECSSVTAEMSPHFRPATWDPTVLTQNNEHLYRFTGQIFFDASHRPCANGSGSPKRSAIWEIHPVYAVDICTANNNNCSVDNDQDWIPLSDFVGNAPASNETRLELPDNLGEFRSGARHFQRPFSERR